MQNKEFIYRAESDSAALLIHLSAIRKLADAEKEALGFIPEGAYRDAIEKRRLVAMLATVGCDSEVVGFVLFSGVFPHARIQQIVVAPQHRRAGIASALINAVVSQLEARGFLSLTAAVASDLPVAQAFYESNGFVARKSRAGGQARKRTIVVRVRDLATESLFSVLELPGAGSQEVVDLGLRVRGASQAPLYAIDLNVVFDVIRSRNRPRSAVAERLVAAALAPRFGLRLRQSSLLSSSDRQEARILTQF